ncbi:Inositol_polyphosphate 5-phosphatase [Hexamita inflata]|uniref:Inositol polyphosphate 5-phosphatase n=1 Tax=Hexamita inflata TaxID=28002 RepID=A0AA86UV34_9EUKA|nr:Inositol polyphosphate 5-phosphatase [Hexamita inflata]
MRISFQFIQYNLGTTHPKLYFMENRDLIFIHTQENSHSIPASFCCSSKASFTNWLIGRLPGYNLIASPEMNAMQSLYFVKHGVKVTAGPVHKIMLGKYGPNKGGIIQQLNINGSAHLFINCHLDSKSPELRHSQAQKILSFASSIPIEPENILMSTKLHSSVFLNSSKQNIHCNKLVLFGDVNARLSCTELEAAQIIENAGLFVVKDKNQPLKMSNPVISEAQIYKTLRDFDELNNGLLQLKERNVIDFAPSYKLNRGQLFYQLRKPGWCDRIFFSDDVSTEKTKYYQVKVPGSDHLPVVLEGTLVV